MSIMIFSKYLIIHVMLHVGILNICNVRRVSCLLYMEDNNGYNLSIFWSTGSIIVVSHGFISESESSIS